MKISIPTWCGGFKAKKSENAQLMIAMQVINRTSFGKTLAMQMTPSMFNKAAGPHHIGTFPKFPIGRSLVKL